MKSRSTSLVIWVTSAVNCDSFASRLTRSRIARTIERRLDAEVETKDEILTRPFDTARIKLLLVASAEEAEKIVEPLLNFEVAVKQN